MLALNTAFLQANIALETKDGNKFFCTLDANAKHSENVLKNIDTLCQKAKIDVLDVETVAVVTGPGSFTGLRIGVAIAKALASVNKKLKLLPISSLQLMAYTLFKSGKVHENYACVINALSGLCFVAYFNEKGIQLKEESLVELTQVKSLQMPIYALTGDFEGENFQQIQISSEDVLDYADFLAGQQKFVSVQNLEPLYLRLSQAEDSLLKKNKKV